jgi:hypothetical protein
MTREQFLAKWATHVWDYADADDPLHDVLTDEETPMDERIDHICLMVIRRNILDMLYDFGHSQNGNIGDAVKLISKWLV